jgi:hypothetical protein
MLLGWLNALHGFVPLPGESHVDRGNRPHPSAQTPISVVLVCVRHRGLAGCSFSPMENRYSAT